MYATSDEEVSATSIGRLFDATTTLFLESGYDGFTVEAAARRADMSVDFASRSWPSKAELLMAALKHVVGELELFDEGCLRSDLLAVTHRIADDFARHGELMMAFMWELRRHPDLHLAYEEAFLRPWHRYLRGVFARAATRGELQPGVDPELVISLIPSAMVFRTVLSRPLDPRLARHLVDYVLVPLLQA